MLTDFALPRPGELTWFDAAALALLLFFAWHGYRRGLLSWLVGVGAALLSFVLAVLLAPVIASLIATPAGWSRLVGERVSFVILLIVLRILLGLALRELVRALRPVIRMLPPLEILDHLLGVLPSIAMGGILVLAALAVALLLPVDPRVHDSALHSYVGRIAVAEASRVIHQLPHTGLFADPQRLLAVGQQVSRGPLGNAGR